jgi:hypothetical protein
MQPKEFLEFTNINKASVCNERIKISKENGDNKIFTFSGSLELLYNTERQNNMLKVDPNLERI